MFGIKAKFASLHYKRNYIHAYVVPAYIDGMSAKIGGMHIPLDALWNTATCW